MIKFYNNVGELVGEYSSRASQEFESHHRELIIYINYKNKGTENSFNISFDVFDEKLDDFYPIQYDDGSQIITYNRDLLVGKYRIPLEVKENEKKVRINIVPNGDSTNIGDIDIRVAVIYYKKPQILS